MADVFLFCTGVVLVSLSGYLIEVTQSWSVVFVLITLVNATGLGVFLIFGGARRVDLVEYSRIIELWPRVIYDYYIFQNMLVFIYLFIDESGNTQYIAQKYLSVCMFGHV